MKNIWTHSNWPNFQFDSHEFNNRNIEFLNKSERLMGRIESLPDKYQRDTIIDLMLSEAIKTSEIKGEILDGDSVINNQEVRLLELKFKRLTLV